MGEENSAVVVPVDTAPRRGPVGRLLSRLTRRGIVWIAAITVAVLVAASLTTVVVVQRIAHQQALDAATDARAAMVASVAGYRAAVSELERGVARGVASRSGVADGVLVHAEVLGGVEALAALTASNDELGAMLERLLGTEPADPPVLRGLPAVSDPAPLDPDADTEQLTASALQLSERAEEIDEERAAIAASTAELDEAIATVDAQLATVGAALPALWDSLLAGWPLASDEAKAAASAAAEAVRAAGSDADVVALIGGYASAASEAKAAHDAETARLAAEAAARAAQPGRRGGGGGGGGGSGGGGTEQRGVLGESNAHRSANSLGALAWNGTLAAHACAFAGELAAANGALYHSGYPGGFATWGENVAAGYGSAAGVVAGWMGSAGHRANILGAQFTLMGACSATSSTGTVYWVQQFGG